MYTVKLNIADIILALEFEEPVPAELVSGFLQGFLSERPAQMYLRVDWEGPQELYWFDELTGFPESGFHGSVYSVTWDVYRGTFDVATRTGRCRVVGMAGLQHFLMALFSVLLPAHDGLMLHAASVHDRTGAYVFSAASGVGKSTLVRNSPGYALLSDEGTLVRFQHGRLYAYGSPFRSDNWRDLVGERVPVRGIYFLEQGSEDRVHLIGEADAMARCLGQTFLYAGHKEARTAAFSVAHAFVYSAPCRVLTLRNGPNFWRCVTG